MDKQTFIQSIKTKYPEYQNVNDDVLYSKIIEKYPVYKSKIKEPTIFDKYQELSNKGADYSANAITEAAKGGFQQSQQGYETAKNAKNLGELLGGSLNMASGAIGAAFSPLAPAFKPIGMGIEAIGNKIGDIPAVQKFAVSPAGEATSAGVEAVGNLANIAGTVAGVRVPEKLPSVKELFTRQEKLIKPPKETPPPTGKKTAIGQVIEDISPTKASIRDRQVAKGLRLAPVEDLANIEQLTGNKLGEWMDRYDLIKNTPGDSATAIAKFKKENLNLVNDSISLLKEKYTFNDIPQAKTAIDFLVKDLEGKKSPEYTQVLDRLNKIKESGTFDAMDLQYIKNVFDDIESIYKKTGEVRDALNAQDKAQTIAPIRRFIEERVKEAYPQIDIGSLNNNIRTASATLDAIFKRAPKADTASIFQLGDMAVIGLGNQLMPGAGFPALFVKKVVESAPIRLRIARYLAGKTKDATKGMTLQQMKDLNTLIQEELKTAIDEPTVNKLQTLQEEIKVKSKQPQILEKKSPKSKSSPNSTTKSLKGKGTIPENSLISEAKKYKSAETKLKQTLPSEDIVNTRGFLLSDGTVLDMGTSQHIIDLRNAGWKGSVDDFINSGGIRLRNTGINGQQNIQIGKIPTKQQIKALEKLSDKLPINYDITINGKTISSPKEGVSKAQFISQLTDIWKKANK